MSRSPSTSQLDALTSCTTLTNCLKAITGNETAVITQGQKLSILLARANSRAPALQGLANTLVEAGGGGVPPTVTPCGGWSREDDRVGDEKESRYRPIKKSSLRAQQMKRTVYCVIVVSIIWKCRLRTESNNSPCCCSRGIEPSFARNRFSYGSGWPRPY